MQEELVFNSAGGIGAAEVVIQLAGVLAGIFSWKSGTGNLPMVLAAARKQSSSASKADPGIEHRHH